MKKTKRIIAVFIAVMMVITMLPSFGLMAFANNVSFTKVTDVNQISADNISECTFEDAKAWILANWDEIKQDSYIDVVYYDGDSLRYIGLNHSTTKEDIEELDDDTNTSLDSIESNFSAWGDAVWICTPASGITFAKVTDVNQISADNISECTFEDAKAWILANWDEIKQDSYIDVVYYDGDSLRYIGLDHSTTKEDIEELDDDTNTSLDSIKSNFSAWGDAVWICTPASSEPNSEPNPEPDPEPTIGDPVSYMIWDGMLNTLVESATPCTNYIELSTGITEWGAIGQEKWYVVSENVGPYSGRVTVKGTVNIIIFDDVSLYTSLRGIQLNEGSTLNIYGQTERTGRLIARPDYYGYSGIGGDNNNPNSGDINIYGVTVDTRGGYMAAAIGGGENGNGGAVNIYGGNVSAESTSDAAAIGGGANGNGGDVFITGYMASVVTIGNGNSGKGIGGGIGVADDGTLAIGSDLTIFGGIDNNPKDVLANEAGEYTGTRYRCLTTSISPIPYQIWNGTSKTIEDSAAPCTNYIPVRASTEEFGKANATTWYVVTADKTFDEKITINGTVNLILCDNTTLTASKGVEVSNGAVLNIYAQSEGENAGVLVAEGSNGAGIGGVDSTITVIGGIVTATGDDNAPGIDGNGAAITVNGGVVTANGGTNSAGLCITDGTIIVNGGTVTANGGTNGAGIGGNYGKDGSTVTVNGGTVTATGGTGAAGIGGGSNGDGASITVNGGTVIANGGVNGAGIGGGYKGEGAEFTVNGGVVTANGGTGAAGIGGGYKGKCGNVEIIDGTVTATGGENAVGIGQGAECGITDGLLNISSIVKLETSANGSTWTDTSRSPGIRTQYMRTSYSRTTINVLDLKIGDILRKGTRVSNTGLIGCYIASNEARSMRGEQTVADTDMIVENLNNDITHFWTIEIVAVDPTAKTDLVYNGSEHELVNPGSLSLGPAPSNTNPETGVPWDIGVMLYSLDSVNWSQSVPKATDAGVYTVYFKNVGVGTESEIKSFLVTIADPDAVPTYRVTWKNWNGAVLEIEDFEEGATPSFGGETPTKPDDAQYTYTFDSWTPTIEAVSGNATYTATFTATPKEDPPVGENTYTVTWENWDGTLLKTITVAKGTEPTYDGETPTKTATAQYTYMFAGWDAEVSQETGDTTYTATFTSTVNEYTITWLNDDGSLIDTTKVAYGTVPTHADPTKAATDQYTYTFKGWNTTPVAVTGEATYTATFKVTIVGPHTHEWTYTVGTGDNSNKITATCTEGCPDGYDVSGITMFITAPELKNEGGTESAEATISGYPDIVPEGLAEAPTSILYQKNKGSIIWSSLSSAPTTAGLYKAVLKWGGKTASVQYTIGEAIPGQTDPTTYTITWLNDDGSLIDTTTVAYGTVPTHAEPTKDATAQYTYTFAGWDTTPVAVTGEATYTATFDETLRSYTITWNNEDGSLIDTTTVAYGTVPTHADATKSDDDQYTYTFAGWNTTPVAVTGEATYTATFTATPKQSEPPVNNLQDFMSVRIDDQIYIKYILHNRENLESVTVTYYDQDGVKVLQEQSYTVDQLTFGEDGTFVILAEVAPAQIGDTVTVTIKANGKDTTYKTSIADYCRYLIANYNGNDAAAVTALAKATLEYGQAANDYFAGTGFYNASEITTITDADQAAIDSIAGLNTNMEVTTGGKISSISYMALTKPEFRFYVNPDCGLTEADFFALNDKITVSGNASAQFVKNEQTGAILLEVTGIEAANMDEVITISIDGFGTITFCGNDFAILLARNASTATLGAALYLYGVKAKECFA